MTNAKPLTTKQTEAMATLSRYKGQTVEVSTSEYNANVCKNFRPVGCFSSSALRGLAARGLIEFDAFWKGGRVTVL